MKKRSKPSLPLLIGFSLLVYVLSYAPAIRYSYGPDFNLYIKNGSAMIDPPMSWIRTNVYVPVEWLIDKTPLRRPLLLWADLWNVRRSVEFVSECRRL